MRTLSIDIETYSSIDLGESGVHRYAESPDFAILLFGYAFDDEPVTVIDLAQGEELPDEVFDVLFDPVQNTEVLKTAYNAPFELTCISSFFKMDLSIEQWECTMVKAAIWGMPMGLNKVAEVLKLENQKMREGKNLINYFSKPCKPTKVNGGRTKNLPHHNPEKWESFKEYCKKDVEVERDIRKKISFFEIPEKEKKLWYLDQKINDTGIKVNMTLIKNAINMGNKYTDKLMTELREITGLENPNSLVQLKKWILDTTGVKVKSLSKETLPDLLEQTNNKDVKKVLQMRQELAKTSTKKYNAINRSVCQDGTVKGQFQFYGASRTGRWAGRSLQPQNLPKNYLPDLDLARNIVLENDLELLEMLYGNVPDTLSQLIRTALVASKESRLIIADFSAIEARIIAWLAGEKWRQEVFAGHGKIYEASASKMFKVPIEEITKDSPLRQKGKVAELSLGYQGGPAALTRMGAIRMGIPEEELPGIVQSWRKANTAIVRFWKDTEKAAIKAIEEKVPVRIQHRIIFYYKKGCLIIRLPSGRELVYMRAETRIDPKYNSKKVIFEGFNQTTKKWEQMSTYGGRFVENITQALARDCLAVSLLKIDKASYKIIMHVHDEVVIDIPHESPGNIEEVLQIMREPLDWAPGLILGAEGYETEYYLKD